MTWHNPAFAATASTLIVLFAAWFAVLARFRVLLRRQDPETARLMGRPGESGALLRFLFAPETVTAVGPLGRFVWALRAILVAYAILFIAIVVMIVL